MKIKLDSLAWIKKSDINVAQIKAELTQIKSTYKGDTEKVELFNDSDEDYLGVPRRWAFLKYDRPAAGKTLTVTNNTKFPHCSIDWPSCDSIDYWEGQEDSIEAIYSKFMAPPKEYHYGALLEADCGTGKTLMGLAVASKLNTPTLVICPKADLMDQWATTALGDDDMEGFFPGIEVGKVQGRKCDWEGKHLVTATVQTLYSQRDKLPQEFWDYFGLVIFDEGHRFPANTFEKVMHYPKARYRLGVSATWRRKDGLECVWLWHVGKIEHTSKVDREGGTYYQLPWDKSNLTDAKFCYGNSNSPNRSNWITAISRQKDYNSWLVNMAVQSCEKSRQMLIVSDRVDQLIALKKEFDSNLTSYTSSYYVGSLPNEEGKKKTLTDAQLKEAKKADVIFATYQKMAEGTDIKTLDTLLLATPRSDVEQVVGRIRRPAAKKPLIVVDPYFTTPWNINNAKAREKTYKKLNFTG